MPSHSTMAFGIFKDKWVPQDITHESWNFCSGPWSLSSHMPYSGKVCLKIVVIFNIPDVDRLFEILKHMSCSNEPNSFHVHYYLTFELPMAKDDIIYIDQSIIILLVCNFDAFCICKKIAPLFDGSSHCLGEFIVSKRTN